MSVPETVTSGTTSEADEFGRVVGALLGVLVGELGRRGGHVARADVVDPPISRALLDLCHAYVAHRGVGVPAPVAAKHHGVHGPAWLLGVAFVRPSPEFVADTLELAAAGGVAQRNLSACVAYVELAVNLLAGWRSLEAIRAVTDVPIPNRDDGPRLVGEAEIDGLNAAVWALSRAEELPAMAETLARNATPAAAAAALGLVGLRDGDGSIPSRWRRLGPPAEDMRAVAPGLARLHSQLRTSGP